MCVFQFVRLIVLVLGKVSVDLLLRVRSVVTSGIGHKGSFGLSVLH